MTDTSITFELEPPTAEQFRARIEDAQAAHDWLVAECDQTIIGYAYAHRFAERSAYGWACETSIYLAGHARGQGVGRALYHELLGRLTDRGYRRALAGVTLPNEASVGLHRAFGFREAGRYHRVGWKHGTWHDVAWLQRDLQAIEVDPPAPVGSGLLTATASEIATHSDP